MKKKTEMKKYIVFITHNANEVSDFLDVRMYSSTKIYNSDLFIEDLETKFKIDNMSNWIAYPINSWKELQHIQHKFITIYDRIAHACGVMRLEEENKNQIPLPIEGEN